MSNTFGTLFRLTSFGESHGAAIGGIIDGCPAGIEIDLKFIQAELNRRRPGQSSITTQRNEADEVTFFSGIFEGKTTGTPIGFAILNTNQHSDDYNHLKDVFRPSHADYTYQMKYGTRDYRGGGRASARETIARVVAGAIAKLVLKQADISIVAYTSQIGPIKTALPYQQLDLIQTETNSVRCPDQTIAKEMQDFITTCKSEGDSIGGIVTCVIKGLPVGLGEPVFDKLQARLAYAMLSINAVKGFDYGSGFESVSQKGSEVNDSFTIENEKITTKTNFSGGIQGGISNGQDIYFRTAFKPTATIAKSQQTIDNQNQTINLEAHGRHDPCVVPRAVPIIEAMAAMVTLDAYLLNKTHK
ncbi:MAG TPA: chorismate synthase [Paludibacteraceae bacterium]|nr:chorismate synthase [Paludibacteraceae bacterium]